MNDINDKLIEGLEEYKIKVAELENELEGNNVIYKMAMKSIQKVSIVNDTLGGDWTDADIPKKMIKVGDYHYAFIKSDGDDYGLMINNDNDNISDSCWGEVSDLTELRVWEYQELKSYAIAVGMIEEDEDLFI